MTASSFGYVAMSCGTTRAMAEVLADIEHDRVHAGVRGHHLAQRVGGPAGDDDLVAALMQRFGEGAAGAAAAARDEEGVVGEFHEDPRVSRDP